jgi:hypothetical protein
MLFSCLDKNLKEIHRADTITAFGTAQLKARTQGRSEVFSVGEGCRIVFT